MLPTRLPPPQQLLPWRQTDYHTQKSAGGYAPVVAAAAAPSLKRSWLPRTALLNKRSVRDVFFLLVGMLLCLAIMQMQMPTEMRHGNNSRHEGAFTSPSPAAHGGHPSADRAAAAAAAAGAGGAGAAIGVPPRAVPRRPRLHIATAINDMDADRFLCTFFQSALWHGVAGARGQDESGDAPAQSSPPPPPPLTVLGWEVDEETEMRAARVMPHGVKHFFAPLLETNETAAAATAGTGRAPPGAPYRPPGDLKQLYNHAFYLGSKPTLLLRWIESQQFGADDLILFTDSSDVVFQMGHREIEDLLEEMMGWGCEGGAATAATDSTTSSRSSSSSSCCYDAILVSGEHDIWPPSFQPLHSQYVASESYLRNSRLLHLPPSFDRASTPGYYRGLNSGTIIGRASRLAPFLRALISERVEYEQHHLVYNSRGSIDREGQQDIVVEGPLRDPDTFAPLARYIVPGVYKRNDQIITAMLYFSQDEGMVNQHRGGGGGGGGRQQLLVPPVDYGIVVDETAALVQTMQLTKEDVASRLMLGKPQQPQPLSVDDALERMRLKLSALPVWADGAVSTPEFERLVELAVASDNRLLQRPAESAIAGRADGTHPLPAPRVAPLVHYNGPSKHQTTFGDLGYSALRAAAFWSVPPFRAAVAPLLSLSRVRAALRGGSQGGVFRFLTRRMVPLEGDAVDILRLCPEIMTQMEGDR